MPDNATNAVEAAEGWTPQEKFVWERVAAGEFADFKVEECRAQNPGEEKPCFHQKNITLRGAEGSDTAEEAR